MDWKHPASAPYRGLELVPRILSRVPVTGPTGAVVRERSEARRSRRTQLVARSWSSVQPGRNLWIAVLVVEDTRGVADAHLIDRARPEGSVEPLTRDCIVAVRIRTHDPRNNALSGDPVCRVASAGDRLRA